MGGGGGDASPRKTTAASEVTDEIETEEAAAATAGMLAIAPLMMLVAISTVVDEKFCWIMAVEDGLVVLAISRKVPGTVACRFSTVIITSSGGL